MPTVAIFGPADGSSVAAGAPLSVTGQATDRGGAEPVMIDSVTVQVDGGVPVAASLKHVRDPHNTVVTFTATVEVTGAEGAHTITVVAVNDEAQSRSASITVFLGPSFQIDAPKVLLEINTPFALDPADPAIQALVGRIQQSLASTSTLLNAAGKLLAGPNLILARDAFGGTVLRIGLWVENQGFTVQPPSPPEFPLPRLSDTAAAAGFALAPLLPMPRRTGFTDLPFAVSISTVAIQSLVDAARVSAHNDNVDSISVSVSPPETMTTTYSGSVVDGVVPYTITVTETLGTAPLPGADPPQSGPTVSSSQSSTVGDLPEWLIGALTVIPGLGLLMVWQEVSRRADTTGGVAGPLVADLPTRIPFHNNALPGSGIGVDFPVLVADWAALGVTHAAMLGNGDATIAARDQSMVGLSIEGPDFVRVPPGEFVADQVYMIALTNLAPDGGVLRWVLRSSIDNSTHTGTLELGNFAQTAFLDVQFPMALHQSPGTYRYTLSITASETCGSDPTKTLSAMASKDINVQKPVTKRPSDATPLTSSP